MPIKKQSVGNCTCGPCAGKSWPTTLTMTFTGHSGPWTPPGSVTLTYTAHSVSNPLQAGYESPPISISSCTNECVPNVFTHAETCNVRFLMSCAPSMAIYGIVDIGGTDTGARGWNSGASAGISSWTDPPFVAHGGYNIFNCAGGVPASGTFTIS